MKMHEAPIGQMVFMEKFFHEYDEVRETYYTPISETRYLHHGCIQGGKVLEDGGRPRYINFTTTGFEYALVPGIVVKPLGESRFSKFMRP